MNATRGRDGEAADEDVLFSPMANPTAPGGEMLGERNPDSVLFDIKKLDGDDDDSGSSMRAGKGKATAEEEASGLIDVKKVLADTSEAVPLPVATANRLASTPPPSEPPPAVESAPDRARTVLLFSSIVTLLIVGALLAFKAMS